MTLGEKIRTARLEAGLSQRQLCGEEITRNMLSLIENGSAMPSMKTLGYLAGRLDKPLGWFLDETAEEEASLGKAWELLNRAEEAIAAGRDRYGRELLEKAEAGVPEVLRRKLLLLGRLPDAPLDRICRELPSLDEELLLRARCALEAGDPERGIRLLRATEEQGAPWHLLMGRLLLKKADYPAAAAQLTLAEAELPGETAPLLEICYRETGDFRRAYEYACKQRK